MSNKIHFIITGGTIDKRYDPVAEKPIMREKSVIPETLDGAIKANFDYTLETLCMIDSVDMTDQIRDALAKSIMASEDDRIVVTHGTSTMELTARFLEQALPANHNKTITITGAMVPITGFVESDGRFNLGCATTAATILPPGVYICMHGECYKPNDVDKDHEAAHFVPRSQ